jgi:hypothetical protein
MLDEMDVDFSVLLIVAFVIVLGVFSERGED